MKNWPGKDESVQSNRQALQQYQLQYWLQYKAKADAGNKHGYSKEI